MGIEIHEGLEDETYKFYGAISSCSNISYVYLNYDYLLEN